MTTTNALNLGLAGSTGTGSFVGATSPTLVTPILGIATATSVAFSPSTGGIVGTTTNNNASSGFVGEFISSVIPLASPVSCANNTAQDLTSISLTAGDWDVWGNVGFSLGGTVTNLVIWISTTSATAPDASLYNALQAVTSIGANTQQGFSAPYKRLSLGVTTTVYISSFTAFSTSTLTMFGGIYARRAR